MLTLQSLVSLALLVCNTKAEVLHSVAELDAASAKFDFIVVGSGPGGATVASRLSENPRFNVLLIEAGAEYVSPLNQPSLARVAPSLQPCSSEGEERLRVPGLALDIPLRFQWNSTVEAHPAVNDRVLNYTRGYVLGGSSSINGMVYSRGSADDYNSWATATGDNGWSWDSLQPYFKKNERLGGPAGGRNFTGEYDPRLHSSNGRVFVTLPSQETTHFYERCSNVTSTHPEFPFLLDMNDGKANGLASTQLTIGGNGERSSAATAYLGPDVRRRRNLSVLLNSYVTRVVSSENGTLSLRTVEIGDRVTRRILANLTASKEVILSGGVIGTPHILLNSGIGNATELSAVGIEPVHDLPDVGKGLNDHSSATLFFTANTQEPIADSDAAMEEWRKNKTGPMTNLPFRQLLWSRIPDNSSVLQAHPDPAPGFRTPHFEIMPVTSDGIAGGVLFFLNSPSKGSVTLRSSNPFDGPLIEVGNLQSPVDIAAFTECVRLFKRFFTGPQWDSPSSTPSGPYLTSPLFPDPDATPAVEFEAFLRGTINTSAHGVGTASMSKKSGKGGVVDPQLRVKGVVGLRVVDASVIPRVPAGHTQVPVYVLAERVADMIKAAWARVEQATGGF